MRDRLDDAIGHWSAVIHHAEVRFADLNGPKGGVDTRCTILVELTGAAKHVVTSDGTEAGHAFALALPRIERAVRRDLEKRAVTAGRSRRRETVAQPLAPAPSLIGRREGRSKAALARTLARPEKSRRDLFTDTAQPGTSQSDRRAGGGHSARRNTRAAGSKMTATLEDSLGRPSRKSSRRSANRGKPSQGKERAAVAKAVTPSARARRGRR